MKENAQTSKRYQRGFEPGLSRLRVRHSTTEPPRSTKCDTVPANYNTNIIRRDRHGIGGGMFIIAGKEISVSEVGEARAIRDI